MKTILVRTLDQWRGWLRVHHDSESEVWLVFYKGRAGLQSIAYAQALDEALCFGWIDSLVKRLDQERYARKFTPRKPDSRWSDTNRRRYAALKADGRLKPSGIERAPAGRRSVAPARYVMATLPPYIEAALRKHPRAWRFFEALPSSHRRHYVGWIDSAKREATKTRRLEEAIGLLLASKRLGLK